MNNFRKSRGLLFHLRRFLCITVSICIVLTGLPVKSQAESPIEIKIDTLQELKTITSTLEKITGLIKDFEIFTPNMREKIVDTIQELKAIISTLEKIMSLLEEFKTITSPVERIMSALEELKTITPTLEKAKNILGNLWTFIPTHGKSLKNVMDTLKEFKTIQPTLEKIINNLEELKTNRTNTIPPDLEGKIRGNLASLRVTMLSLDRKIWNNLAQISTEMSRSTPTATAKPTPATKTTQPSVHVEKSRFGLGDAGLMTVADMPLQYVEKSGFGLGDALLLGGAIAGAVALVAAVAGKKEENTSGGGGDGGGGGGCESGYAPCGSYGVCCYDLYKYCPKTNKCYSTYTAAYNACGNDYVTCHNKVSGIGKIPANLNYNALKLSDSGLTLFNSNLSRGMDLFKTKFEILGACSGNDSMLTTTLGLQVKSEYSRLRGQFIFSPFIQLQNQRSGSLTEFAENNVSVYTTTLYGMDIHYVPYNMTLSSMIRQAIQSEESESLNVAVVQLAVKF